MDFKKIATSNASPIWPLLAVGCLLPALSEVLDFNGLYGQDAHEYLRQSKALLNRLYGLPAPPPVLGDAEIAGGYSFAGALLQCLGLDAVVALRCVSWLAAVLALWLFERMLRVLSPGTRWQSRQVFGLLMLGLCPVFFRAGLVAMSDTLGLALLFAAWFFALRAVERQQYADTLGFVAFALLAELTRYANAPLFLLPGLALGLELWRERKWGILAASALPAIAALVFFMWLKSGAPQSPLAHNLFARWELGNFFKSTLDHVDYDLPNLLYLFFPLLHPNFCLTLPALFLLARRTDAGRYSKRLLLWSVLLYLFFLGGVPHQNTRYLLPAYALILLLLFPAWDRFFAYGFYFFKRLTWALITLTLACQLFFSARFLTPVLARNRLERQSAELLHPLLPPGAEVYAIDLDIALQTYLPDVQFRNLWARRYDSFEPGSYFLFNEPRMRTRWAGQNPMLNWTAAQTQGELLAVQNLPEGWVLYRYRPRG